MTTFHLEGDAYRIHADEYERLDGWPQWLKDAWEKPDTEFGSVHTLNLRAPGATKNPLQANQAVFLMTSGGRVTVRNGDWLVCDAGGELHRFSDEAYQRMAAG